MSDVRGDSRSPSPDEQACASSYRSSRAASEVPIHRPYDSMSGVPRSRNSSRCSSLAGSDVITSGISRTFESQLGVTSPTRRPDGRADCDTPNGKKAKPPSAFDGVGRRAPNAWTAARGVTRPMVVSETRKTLYHSIPHAGGDFRFLQQLHYPFDPPDAALKCRDPSQSLMVDGESAEYEATGELHPVNSAESNSSRSVVRQEVETVESAVCSLALGMLPDPVNGRPALAIGIGDANGRVNYYEIGVGPHVRYACSPLSASLPGMSNVSVTSHSQTDVDNVSYATSLQSTRSLTSDALSFQRPPVRRHSHQAYVHEMDCLTSVTFLQSIRTLRFFRSHESPNIVSYLTSNERVIKLFRVPRGGFSPFHAFPAMESVVGRRLAYTRYFPRSTPPSLTLPVRVFAGCHSNLIQDLSICADEQTFLSVDDLQVFWWNLESTEGSKGVCITDYRPVSGCMDDVEELITAAAFHPSHSSLFLVSRSSGVMGVGDLRDPPSRCERQFVTSMRVPKDPAIDEQCRDILCSISDAKFLGPNHVVSRDYLTLKLWDLRQPSMPCSTVPVMNYVSPHLNNLYESDAIFDRFPLAVDHVSGTVLTGLYDGAVSVWQPLSEGKIDANDALVYYHADSQALPCEVENDGRTTAEALSTSFMRSWEMYGDRNCAWDENAAGVPETISNKVLSLAVADGGERFAFTCNYGRCIFVFERRASMGDACHTTVKEQEQEK